VPPKTTRLTGLLRELEDLLDELGAPFSSYALPGIDDDQIDELLAPSGLVAPTELREWWRWHHGTRIDGPGSDRHTLGPGLWGLMDIPWALEDAAEWESTIGEEGWGPSWLPFAWAKPDHARLVARLGDSTPDEVCVGWHYVFDVPPDEPIARSLAEVVEDSIRILREGLIVWDGSYSYYDEVGMWKNPRLDEFGRWKDGCPQVALPRHLQV
jgi:hypothetical protein